MSGPQGPFERRRSGILAHLTSLPGAGTCGTLGPDAYRFVDFLAAAGVSVWQLLPIGPTHADGSPYNALSLHAGHAHMISVRRLAEEGLIEPPMDDGWDAALAAVGRTLAASAESEIAAAYQAFVQRQAYWLEDYALFQALRDAAGHAPWWEWPASVRDRDAAALADARTRLRDKLAHFRLEQFLFERQWQALRRYANERGVLLFGDMPIFVAHDSVDVWVDRKYFALDAAGRPESVAGVPPDYFAAHGQRWGNPQYRWERMQADGFAWWVERLETLLARFDLIRIDHFRGFESYWEIPASEATAVTGRWVPAPGHALFETLRRHFGQLPLVAEDLGHITPEVHALRRAFGLPGMSILQFAFDGDGNNPYLPHNLARDSVVYTGTHDNDTSRGWHEALPESTRQRVAAYLGHSTETMPWPLIRSALASVAELAVIPMQDVLGLGSTHRMNTPGTETGNWQWRFSWDQVPDDLSDRLRTMNGLYGRT